MWQLTGLILGLRPATNERHRYKVTPSRIGLESALSLWHLIGDLLVYRGKHHAVNGCIFTSQCKTINSHKITKRKRKWIMRADIAKPASHDIPNEMMTTWNWRFLMWRFHFSKDTLRHIIQIMMIKLLYKMWKHMEPYRGYPPLIIECHNKWLINKPD